jgi:hypothetical protein
LPDVVGVVDCHSHDGDDVDPHHLPLKSRHPLSGDGSGHLADGAHLLERSLPYHELFGRLWVTRRVRS